MMHLVFSYFCGQFTDRLKFVSGFFCFVFLITMLMSGSTRAQLRTEHVSATITLKSGETKIGFIRDDATSAINNQIHFKSDLKSNSVILYDTSNVQKLEIESGEVYENLGYKPHGENRKVTVIARLLLRGKASLYNAIYEGELIYLVTNNGEVTTLQNDKIVSGDYVRHFYRNFLFLALHDEPDLQKSITGLLYREKDFIDILTEYNNLKTSKSEVISVNKKKVHFILVGGGGMIHKSEDEMFLQFTYRTFYPKLSRHLSFNIGLNYFNFHYIEKRKKYSGSLVSIPLQVQENILSGNIRPYLFGGLNLSYFNLNDPHNAIQLEKGFQKTYGINLLYGAGIEANVYKGLTFKTEYRFENFTHLVLLTGIVYCFKTGND